MTQTDYLPSPAQYQRMRRIIIVLASTTILLGTWSVISGILALQGSRLSFPIHLPDLRNVGGPGSQDTLTRFEHPIEQMMLGAQWAQEKQLKERSWTVRQAAAEYRRRRGRHPPPMFDQWVEYALKHDAILIEGFFDRIYHDLAPFWALDARVTAERAATWDHVVRVRDGKVEGVGNVEGRVPWLQLWTALVNETGGRLPDVDMPVNMMDESRVLVPWDEVDRYTTRERRERQMPPARTCLTSFSKHHDAGSGEQGHATPGREVKWMNDNKLGAIWDIARQACDPLAAGRNVAALADYSSSPVVPPGWSSPFSYNGFVQNFTASADPCTQPHLQGMIGSLVEPVSLNTTQELTPVFSGCKLPMNNDILIPGAMYLSDEDRFSTGDEHGVPWKEKSTSLIWRGVASGGRKRASTWTHFHRHRLVEMLNASAVAAAEANGGKGSTFDLGWAAVAPVLVGNTSDFLRDFADVGFIDLQCFPRSECDYVAPCFHNVEAVPMAEQFKHKFIPDADGNSYSARFRCLLLSTSLPLKATTYVEWHDDRLRPWLHFVPLDNTFRDLYAVLDFFTRDEAGDKAAAMIASMGKEWTEKVLRREDMLLYVWRLLLEFARVCDEKRDRLGYIADLESR